MISFSGRKVHFPEDLMITPLKVAKIKKVDVDYIGRASIDIQAPPYLHRN